MLILMNKKLKYAFTICFIAALVFMQLATIKMFNMKPIEEMRSKIFNLIKNDKITSDIVEKNYEDILNFIQYREEINMSNLGDILFRKFQYPKMKKKEFNILIWKNGPFLEKRHIYNYQTQRKDPLNDCSVNNCIITYDMQNLSTADAVVFLLHRTVNVNDLPDSKMRHKDQRWIFLSDESPFHTFLYRKNNWKDYVNIFNWSMNYKMESDIPVPYGRTVPLEHEINYTTPILDIIPNGYQKRRDVLVAIMISNCQHNRRWSFLNELSKYINIHIYGKCGKSLQNECPGHFKSDCPKLNDYLFYLAFENSECDQYMTEKLFWNAYHKGSIPIILGPKKEYCKIILPSNSYIHVDDYARPIDVARHLLHLNKTFDESIFDFHQWRRHFAVLNEHGYFGSKSVHYCRICEALNYNDEESKIYTNLDEFLSIENNCVL